MTTDHQQQQQPLDIVLSFPFPPKCFYEKLSEEEIVSMRPPEFPFITEYTEINLFGTSQKLKLENVSVTNDLIDELKHLNTEIMDQFKGLLSEIEIIQDSQQRIHDTIKNINEPFEKIFEITAKLRSVQSVVSLNNYIEKEFKEIETFLKEE